MPTDLNYLTEDNVKLDGAKLRNRQFMLSIFDHAWKNIDFIRAAAKEALLDHKLNDHITNDKLTDDVLLRAEVLSILDDLMRGIEGINIGLLHRKNSFERIHDLIKTETAKFEAAVAADPDNVTP
jgi:hypothetical protein